MEIDDAAWAALVARVPAPGVYAVTTTGIACRFGCPARTPRRRNVLGFPSLAAAQAAGFRPCLRCWRPARATRAG